MVFIASLAIFRVTSHFTGCKGNKTKYGDFRGVGKRSGQGQDPKNMDKEKWKMAGQSPGN